MACRPVCLHTAVPESDSSTCPPIGPLSSGPGADFPGGAVDLGDGVQAWMQPNGSWGETNAGLVSDGDSSLLVDTLWDADLAGRMLAGFGATLERAPVRQVVTTHRDGDHWWGNVVLPPEATVVATRAAADEMAHEPPPAALARLRRLARLGASLPGGLGRVSAYTSAMLAPFAFDGLRLRRRTRRSRVSCGCRSAPAR